MASIIACNDDFVLISSTIIVMLKDKELQQEFEIEDVVHKVYKVQRIHQLQKTMQDKVLRQSSYLVATVKGDEKIHS